MGHKHSKNRHKLSSIPETTEVFEINDSRAGSIVPTEPTYPHDLKAVIARVESIEKSIEEMTASQINLYYATLKDDLHNNWQKVYDVIETTSDTKDTKIEVIERIKTILKGLNDKVLIKARET